MEVDQLESGVQVCAIVQTLVLTARARGKCPRWGGKLSTDTTLRAYVRAKCLRFVDAA